MGLALSRWRPQRLLLAWSIYWAGLVLVGLGPGILAAWRVTRPGKHGTVSATFDDLLRITVTGEGATRWTGSYDVGTLALWLAGPPLLLWVAWLISRPRRDAIPAAAPRQLGPGAEPMSPIAPARQAEREWRDRTV